MKKKLIRVILCCAFIVLLEGCNEVEKTEEIQEYENVEKETQSEKIETPKTESFEIISEDGVLSVKVAAQIVVPEGDKIPIIEAKEKQFTGKDLKKFAGIFEESVGLDYFRDYDEMTKEELQEEMQLKTYFADEILGNDFYSEDEKEELEKEIEKDKRNLQRYYENAPETVKKVPIEYKLSIDKEKKAMGTDAQKFYIKGILNGEFCNMFIDQGEEGNSIEYSFNDDTGTFQGFFKDYKNVCILSNESAKIECEYFIDELDLKQDFELVQMLPLKDIVGEYYTGYRFIYKRKLNGIVETYDQQDSNVMRNYEKIIFEFGRQGLARILWDEPMEINKTLVEDVEIISYERMLEIFKKKVFLNSKLSSPKNKVYYVDKIVLGLMRVTNPNNNKEFCYIPVWDFYNSEDSSGINSLLTINAIDGSIVNRSIGY